MTFPAPTKIAESPSAPVQLPTSPYHFYLSTPLSPDLAIMAYQMMFVEPDTEKALSQNAAESPLYAQQSPYDYASDLGAEQSIQLIQILLTACVRPFDL